MDTLQANYSVKLRLKRVNLDMVSMTTEDAGSSHGTLSRDVPPHGDVTYTSTTEVATDITEIDTTTEEDMVNYDYVFYITLGLCMTAIVVMLILMLAVIIYARWRDRRDKQRDLPQPIKADASKGFKNLREMLQNNTA